MFKIEKPIAFIDFETTGTDVKTARIVSIAVSKLKPNMERGTVPLLVNPEIPIPPEATAIHKITDDMVKDAPNFRTIAPSFLKYIEGCDIGGFNIIGYDIPVLMEELHRAKMEFNFDNVEFFDMMTFHKKLYRHTLGAVYEFYFGKPLEDAHSAEADAKASCDIMMKMAEVESDKIGDEYEDWVVFGNPKADRVDFAGKFTRNNEGTIVFNGGKNNGQIAGSNRNYLEWMINKSGYPRDTVAWAQRIHDANFGNKAGQDD